MYSRHQLNQYLLRHAGRIGTKRLAGLLLDIDDFKSINDRFGHLTGDDAIANVGTLLRQSVLGIGQVFRYAGDEFDQL